MLEAELTGLCNNNNHELQGEKKKNTLEIWSINEQQLEKNISLIHFLFTCIYIPNTYCIGNFF